MILDCPSVLQGARARNHGKVKSFLPKSIKNSFFFWIRFDWPLGFDWPSILQWYQGVSEGETVAKLSHFKTLSWWSLPHIDLERWELCFLFVWQSCQSVYPFWVCLCFFIYPSHWSDFFSCHVMTYCVLSDLISSNVTVSRPMSNVLSLSGAGPQVLLACSCSNSAIARCDLDASPSRLLSTHLW